MKNSKLTERWQTTIPKAVRREMQLKPGMRIQWEIQEDGTAIVRPEKSPLDCFESLKGEKRAMSPLEQLDKEMSESCDEIRYEGNEQW